MNIEDVHKIFIDFYGEDKVDLQENDIINSYKIMIEAAVLADRWSEIKFEISKDLVRGDPLKKRLQEKYDILMNIHVNARQIWLKCQEERTKKYE